MGPALRVTGLDLEAKVKSQLGIQPENRSKDGDTQMKRMRTQQYLGGGRQNADPEIQSRGYTSASLP